MMRFSSLSLQRTAGRCFTTTAQGGPITVTEQRFSSPPDLGEQANEIIAHRKVVYDEAPIPSESLSHKFFRYCDIFGTFSRWNDRKYWCLTAPPLERMEAVMLTEFERKARMFVEINRTIFLYLLGVAGFVFYYYRNARQPLPQVYGLEQPYEQNLGRYSVFPFQYPKLRCNSCRVYDPECKKLCFEKLRSSGMKLFLDDTYFRAWSTPRINLKPSKFIDHSPATASE